MGLALTYQLVSQAAHGFINIQANGSFTYTPNANYFGADTAVFKVVNINGDVSNLALATFNINSVNDIPTVGNQNITTDKNQAIGLVLVGLDIESAPLTYSIVTAPLHGTISGTAPNLTYTPNNNYVGTDSFTYKVNDGQDDSSLGLININVVYVDKAPVSTNLSFAVNEDSFITDLLPATDENNDPIVFSISAQPTHGSVVLNTTTGEFTYTPTADYSGTDFFAYRAFDGTNYSNVSIVTMNVLNINDLPIADNKAINTNEDTAILITLSGTDLDGDTLTFTVVTSPLHGTLTGTAPNLTYTPATNYNGSDSFTYKINDGTGDSNTATVSITVNPVNDAPVSQGQLITTAEDTSKLINLVATDIDGDLLSYSIVTQPTNGILVLVGSDATYIPNLNYHGPDSFTFKANDGTTDSNSSTVAITVTPVNDAPVANGQSLTVTEDNSGNITLTGSDVDGDALTYSIVSNPSHGTISGTGSNRTYTPNSNYSGPDSFTFKVNDGIVDSNVATVSITVTPVNDVPVAVAQTLTTNEDTDLNVTLSGIDADGDTLTYAIVSGPLHGTLTGTGANIVYKPSANYNGSDSFTFKVNDGLIDSAAATVSITVSAINDAPVANNQSLSTNEDNNLNITLTGSDIDLDSLTYIIVSGPTNGSLTGTGANRVYTPNANFNGTDTFTFKVNDGNLDSNTATITVNVLPINDAPVSTNQTITTAEDTAKSITLGSTDADGDTLTYVIVSAPTHGILTGTGSNITYTPSTNYNGSDSFTFKTNDGMIDSNTATVSITVSPVNDIPVANNQSLSTPEDVALNITLTGTDVDGDSLTYVVVSSPSYGTLTGTGANLVYTPNANYHGLDAFTFRVNDGTVNSATATVSLTVNSVNDIPTVNNQNITLNEDATFNGTLTGSDIDGDTLSFRVVDSPNKGSVVINSNGTFTYTPREDEFGSDRFTFVANDGTADSAVGMVSVVITAINDAPLATNSSYNTEQNTAINVGVSGSDVDGDILTYTITQNPTLGTLSGTAPNLVYTPNNSVSGTDIFKYRVYDGALYSAEVSVSINILNNGNWDLVGWLNRRKLLINNARGGAIVNATVLVRLDTSNFNYAKVQSLGQDLRFVDSQGNSLSYTIEKFSTLGESLIWVKVPTINSGSTSDFVWMYYNNSGASSADSSASVWSQSTLSFEMDDSTDQTDLSVNGLNLIKQGSPVVSLLGQVGKAIRFAFNSDYFYRSNSTELTLTNFTLEAWVFEETRGANSIIIQKSGQYGLYSDSGKVKMEAAGVTLSVDAGQEFSLNAWHHVVGVFDNVAHTCKIYVDGILKKSGTCNNTPGNTASLLLVGGNGSSNGFKGSIDNLKIYPQAKDDSFIQSQKLTASNNFTVMASENTYGQTPVNSQLLTIKSTLDDGQVNEIGSRINTDVTIRQGNDFECVLLLICVDRDNWGYYRMQVNQTIPSSANIVNAKMRLYASDQSGWNLTNNSLNIYLQNSVNAGQVSGNNICPTCSTSISLVGSSVTWNNAVGLSWLLGSYQQTPNISTLINSLITNKGTISSGNYIQFWVSRQANYGLNKVELGSEDYSANNFNQAQLLIEWTE